MARFNFLYRELVLRTLRCWRRGWARLSGRRFCCKTLSGEATLGCYVNSDMTVSCNCQDLDGSGQLGDLRQNTFEEVFAGPRARQLREALARGRLPLNRCAACWSLETAAPRDAETQAQTFHLPQGLCIENTVLCNLRCLSCCREEVLATRKQGRRLTPEDVDSLGRTLQRLRATFCGFYNLGEPFFSPTIRQELETLRMYNPAMEIFISTNGVLINNDEKRAAALLADQIVVSLDGVSTPMVRRYQRGGDFEAAYENLKALVALRDSLEREKPRIGWKYVLFRWNDHPATIRTLLQLAEAAGVDYVQLTSSRTPWYGASWRFYLSPFHRSLGKRTGRFRDIRLPRPAQATRDAA